MGLRSGGPSGAERRPKGSRLTDTMWAPRIGSPGSRSRRASLSAMRSSGDESPNDRHNNQFRQSGLHTNETRFGGLSKFKIYGEALDPELSNIEIFTAGVGFRPFSNVFVD